MRVLMETQVSNKWDSSVFWIQIAISIFFGMATYYLAVYLPWIDLGSGLWGFTLNFIIISTIYLALLFVVPFVLLQFKTEKTVGQSFSLIVRDFTYQLPLYFLLLTLNYLLTMQV